MIQNQSGSASVETISSMVLLVPVMIVGLSFTYFSFARIWCERSAYEATVCLASLSQKSDCEKQLRKDLRLLQLTSSVGQVDHMQVSRNSDRARVDFKFGFFSHFKSDSLHFEELEFKTHSELKLPLTASENSGGFFSGWF